MDDKHNHDSGGTMSDAPLDLYIAGYTDPAAAKGGL